MKQSNLHSVVAKEIDREEVSRNAQLLTRAGYIDRLMAGVYSYLPLGVRTLTKIENIIRAEMNALGSQEILLPALQPREIWDTTGRWDTVDILFRLKGHGERDLALGPTHEEVVTPLIGKQIQSYRDLPKSVYQIQTKFRNEARAKSGLLRGREFRMKDMYSFHQTQGELDSYYDLVLEGYNRIFAMCGVGEITEVVAASGGIFSKLSHEFQTITDSGEDTILTDPESGKSINRELLEYVDVLGEMGLLDHQGNPVHMTERRAIEVGNIFKLGTRFSEPFGVAITDASGLKAPVYMGCYGLGPTRLMGAIAECCNDARGLCWPKSVSPFDVHLLSLVSESEQAPRAFELYEQLTCAGVDVLFDDRLRVRPGVKFAEADLIGIPLRLVLGPKSLERGEIEVVERKDGNTLNVRVENVVQALS